MARRVVIIGAGIAGVLAGQTMAQLGWQVLVVESQRCIGGRLATRVLAGNGFDIGAQFFSVRSPAFSSLVQQWQARGLVQRWCEGFLAWSPTTSPQAVEDGFARWHAIGGMGRLAERMADGLPVRCGVRALRLDTRSGTVRLHVRGRGAGAQDARTPAMGTAHGHDPESGPESADGVEVVEADAAILTAPVPLSLELLGNGVQERQLPASLAAQLASIRYAPCIALMLDFAQKEDPALPDPGGMRVDHPVLAWVASQRAKGLRARGEGLVVHAQAGWSEAQSGVDDAHVGRVLGQECARLLADMGRGDWRIPTMSAVERWRYSLATATLAPPFMAVDLGAPVIFAGDAFGGQPRMEGAALSGCAAAAWLGSGPG